MERKNKINSIILIISFFVIFSSAYIWAFSFKDIKNFFEKKGILSPPKTIEENQKPQENKDIFKKESFRQESTFKDFTELEKRIIKISEEANNSVVSIIVTKDLPVLEQYYTNPFDDFFNDPFFKQFFGDEFGLKIPQYRKKGTEKKEIGAGTGFIISSDGLILTNKHVVEDENAEYTVLTNNGEKIPAKVLIKHPVLDLALVKIEKTGLKPLKLGNSDNLKIGQFVIAIGNALGEFRNTVSFGIISGLKRNIVAGGSLYGAEELDELIQTDAAINRGNSGGPLLNTKGEVIGINTAMAVSAQNIGFAIPINKAKKMIEEYQKYGRIRFPFMGIRYIIINPYVAQKNNLQYDYGALVVRGKDPSDLAVIPGSPAAKAGIKENDIILEVNGEKITQKNSLVKILSKYSPGDKLKLKILRNGKIIFLDLILGERK